MNSQKNIISNDISRAVLDYISENEKEKKPTKNITKVGQALGLIRELMEKHTETDRAELLSIDVSYGDTDVTITITLPQDWSFDKKALKTWRSLLGLVDGMFHKAATTGEDGTPIDDNFCFVIRDVFEAKAE